MVEKSLVTAIDEGIPYKVETDASEVTLVAALSQDGKTVAFFSHSLQGKELSHAATEKKAQAIIEAVRHYVLKKCRSSHLPNFCATEPSTPTTRLMTTNHLVK